MDIDLEKENIKQKYGFIAYIPQRLEIKDRPELSLFSLNFLMARYTVRGGKTVMGTALYEPDLSSFKIAASPKRLMMNYYNKHDRRARLLMKIDIENKKRECIKYFSGKETGTAFGPLFDNGGDAWKLFFMQVGFLGFKEGERCEFTDMEDKKA